MMIRLLDARTNWRWRAAKNWGRISPEVKRARLTVQELEGTPRDHPGMMNHLESTSHEKNPARKLVQELSRAQSNAAV